MSEITITEEQRALAAKILAGGGFSKLLGLRLESLEPGRAVISMAVQDEFRQPHGVLHGGATASLIDTAMAYAVITRLSPEEKASTVDLTVHYLRPHTEGRLICTATIVRAGKRLLTVSAEAVNESGKIVATSLSTYTKL